MRLKFGRYAFVLMLACLFFNSAYAQIEGLTGKWGSYCRLRHEYWKDWKDMDSAQLDNRNFFRVKSSLWGQLDYEKDLSLYAKLTNEFKPYTYWYQTASRKKGYHFDINEVVFDNLYLDVKNLSDLPVDVRLGRQDFLGAYGEGFLITDGTPADGSRTFYFNAVKAAWRADDQNTLEFIYIRDPRDDIYLPAINEDKSPQGLNQTAEEAYVLYLKNKTVKDVDLEGYYIYKREDDDGGAGYQAEKGIINTLGSFAKYNSGAWTLRTQLAYQFGDYGNNDRRGLGNYTFVEENFKQVLWSPTLGIGFIYLSGDDKTTSKNEGWDPLFSRSPWISELYSLSMSAETGINAYWTNLEAWRASLVLNPMKKTRLSFWYNFFRADEQVAASTIFSGEGKKRGHLTQAKIEYTFNKNVSTYFLAEYFIPSDFYKNDSQALFLRSELTLKF
ncbi:MAG: alginate export family protein [Candidatus Omnitrophota bacterium]